VLPDTGCLEAEQLSMSKRVGEENEDCVRDKWLFRSYIIYPMHTQRDVT